MHDLGQTIVAPATGNQSTAIGVIRMSGPQTYDILKQCFDGKISRPKRGVYYGHIKQDSRIIDEVVVVSFPGPNSYTRQDTAEINCHGSPFIIEEIIKLLISKGATLAQTGEFTYRTFLNGRMDLAQSEAVTDLIASSSAAQHRIAMNQMKGQVSDDIKLLRQKMIDFASLIELELDFGEEDVEFANREDLITNVEQAIRHLSKLIDSFKMGNAIKKGVPVAIIGAPNAGKSTLLNALLGDDRAIVSDIPGTTRDSIEDLITINGLIFRFIDTAGIRDTADQIEAEGVERALRIADKADIILLVVDVENTSNQEITARLEELQKPDNEVIVVINKMDRFPYAKSNDFTDHSLVLPISAKNNMNIEALKDLLVKSVGMKDPSQEVIISNIRHYDALKKAMEDLSRVKDGLGMQIPGDLIAMDIRQAMHHVGTITGEISADDLLGNIFSRFCIGK